MKEADKYWQKRVQEVNPGLFIVWNGLFNKWQILHKNNKTGQVRKVMFVMNPEFGYMDLNDNVIYQLRRNVRWDLVNEYGTSEEMLEAIDAENEALQAAYKRKRLDDINTITHEDRRLWAAAVEDLRSTKFKFKEAV